MLRHTKQALKSQLRRQRTQLLIQVQKCEEIQLEKSETEGQLPKLYTPTWVTDMLLNHLEKKGSSHCF